ncbi:MAG: hypothetical protein ACOX0R_01810 [Candidatus Dojkabacteria bacterium]|jgi:hypothetical protein
MEPTDDLVSESTPQEQGCTPLNNRVMGNFDPSCSYLSILKNNRTNYDPPPENGGFYTLFRLTESQKLFMAKLMGMPTLEKKQKPGETEIPLLSDAIYYGLDETSKTLIEYENDNQKFLLRLTPEINETLFFKVQRDHLVNLISAGLRIEERNGLDEEIMPTKLLLSGYEDEKTIAEKTENLHNNQNGIREGILELILLTKDTNSPSQLCLGSWMTITLPKNLDLEKRAVVNSRFIAKLVVNGFRVKEISDI